MGLDAMYNAALLSHRRSTGVNYTIVKSFSKESNHTISQQALAIDLYSASANDLATTVCFFIFQEIRD